MAAASRATVKRLMQAISIGSCRCPSHSNHTTLTAYKEYAFELVTSTIRFGEGVTNEVGRDLVHLNAAHVAVFTDPKLSSLPPVQSVTQSLDSNNVQYDVFDRVKIEPTDESFQEAIDFVRSGEFNYDAVVAVGGGSVMDTAKAANLYLCHPNNEFLDFVNHPIGKGLPVMNPLKPLICIPTTAGTGSETTGTAIFDYAPLKVKTGISSRSLRPFLGLIDPNHVMHMPRSVATYSGFDVLCHALESYTALPYNERTPRPDDPILRPAYQGSNPISDIWSQQALVTMKEYFVRSVTEGDLKSRSEMHLASVCAGVGFGNAGVHLPHGMSYPVSGLRKEFMPPEGYDRPMIPHGLSVVLTAPAVFEFTSPLCPERHLKAAQLLGADVNGCSPNDGGRILADTIREYMHKLDIPNGLSALGYSYSDVPALVEGTLPQHRVTKLSPREFNEEQLAKLFENSMTVY